MGIIMKKAVIIFMIFALAVGLFGCAANSADTQPPQDPDDLQPRQTDAPAETTSVSSEPEDDYVRYTGGGISILLEGGFRPTTEEPGYIVYSNGFLTVILSATDDYDRQMLENAGYDFSALTEEDYASILVDANKLSTDSIFYDHFDNVCMRNSGATDSGSTYEAYNVVKKDEAHDRFWLLQFIGSPAVYEPYSVYFPEWADSALFE